MSDFRVRTDLALEAREYMEETDEEIRGVKVEESFQEETDIRITKVIIETKNGAKAMGKPIGTYITLEAPNMIVPDEDYHREISLELAKQIRELIPDSNKEQSILAVGLGNREVTPDSLGPQVMGNLLITRHIVKEYGKAAYGTDKIHLVSSIVPGVMAQTGMDTSEIIRGIIKETSPDVLVVVDALAARSTKRLNRTIQITNTGIHPGSGVGNHRKALTEETLGIPVIAIGVPTVVDAATIVNDAIDNMTNSMSELNNMYVTPKDIDETVKNIGFTISEALNIALEI
ncbi:GPR endopeptidase [bacterium 1XD42-8]|jgi:spore protease|nr:GPR endopeptidase [Lachnospiraceae bacterium]RKJ50427.1 GPR endopeptidase [bacterium 1XD42-8]